MSRIACGDPEPEGAGQEIREALTELAAQRGFPGELREIAQALAADIRFKVHLHPNRFRSDTEQPVAENQEGGSFGGIVLVGSGLLASSGDGLSSSELVSSEDDTASATVSVPLDEHAAGVADLVGRYAHSCGLGDGLRLTLIAAARGHDAGKADPRFQAWLHNGNAQVARLAPGLLAKSGGLPQSRRQRERARARSGYPRGARHELVSVRLAEGLIGEAETGQDCELFLHLIGSHHGYCRPLAPLVDDFEPVEVEMTGAEGSRRVSSATGLHELDSGVAERYWVLVRRYGWWGLAWLEALLRLADHRRSAIEQEGGTL